LIGRVGRRAHAGAARSRHLEEGAHVYDATHTAGSPTVVLVHGAFADALSWNGVIERLQAKGVQVTAWANPGSGHDVPQEAPHAFADAALELGGAT
jgi:alpha-beta hydrolase superfamily lysophospholipase